MAYHEKRHLCLMFVNDVFNDEVAVEKRPDAWREAMALKEALRKFGRFDFKLRRNATVEEMKEMVETGESDIVFSSPSISSFFFHSESWSC